MEFAVGYIAGALSALCLSLLIFRHFSKMNKLEFEKIGLQGLKLQEENVKREVSEVLTPLRDRLKEYEAMMAKLNDKGIENTSVLRAEIKNMLDASKTLGDETNRLTNALRADNKMQGNWGEMVLEKVLESSGLSKGREYFTQEGYRNDAGKLLKPDVVIRFPEGAGLVIDSKVSLLSYEKFVNSETPEESEAALKELKLSLKAHIDGLSSKKYEELEEINSPEYVLMFIPIESALSAMMQNESELIEYAWKKRVILTGPSNLMVILKTVHSLWKVELQNQNAKEIAKKAALLYDKFFVFYEDLLKMESDFAKMQDRFSKSLNRLRDGKGNLVSRVEEFKELGV